VLGNHDLDILSQEEALAVIPEVPNSSVNSGGGAGYHSFELPTAVLSAPPARTEDGNATSGCLVQVADQSYIWVVHEDGTRNWLGTVEPSWHAAALTITNVTIYPKRDGGVGHYDLTAAESDAAFEQRCTGGCKCDANGVPKVLPAPGKPVPPAPPPGSPPIRFITLNADFTNEDVAWADLNNAHGPGAVPGMSWESANVPTVQMEWLAEELEAALVSGQHVIVFVHYRVDGGR
jgi:hypothetical protein